MPYYVFRDHCCPVISNIHQTIMKWYKTEIQKYDCVPTSFAIDYKIRKKWKREDCQWQNISISIPVGSADIQFTALAAESFNQYYNDIKPEGTFYVLEWSCY
jgi:hypothetical protein